MPSPLAVLAAALLLAGAAGVDSGGGDGPAARTTPAPRLSSAALEPQCPARLPEAARRAAWRASAEAAGGIDFGAMDWEQSMIVGPDCDPETDPDCEPLTLEYILKASAHSLEAALAGGATSPVLAAFAAWVALDEAAMLVNLNPSEPERIIDASLQQTDAGKVLLESDLNLKRSIARKLHPDSPVGAQFWVSLYENLAERRELEEYLMRKNCISFRTWVRPGKVQVYEEDTTLFILDAQLIVEHEITYLAGAGEGYGETAAGCDWRENRGLQDLASVLYEGVVLPRLADDINAGGDYETLRQMLMSRIMAEWYTRRWPEEAAAVDAVPDWVPRPQWDPQAVYQGYLRSVRTGEHNVTRTLNVGEYEFPRVFTYGEVDFSRVELTWV